MQISNLDFLSDSQSKVYSLVVIGSLHATTTQNVSTTSIAPILLWINCNAAKVIHLSTECYITRPTIRHYSPWILAGIVRDMVTAISENFPMLGSIVTGIKIVLEQMRIFFFQKVSHSRRRQLACRTPIRHKPNSLFVLTSESIVTLSKMWSELRGLGNLILFNFFEICTQNFVA